MSTDKSLEEINRQIGQKLIRQSYISLNELKKQFSEYNIDIMDILEKLQQSFDNLGMQLDIIELDQLEYVVISTKIADKDSSFTDKEYTVLGIFAQLIKLQGNSIEGKEIYQLFGSYWKELDSLQKYHLIEHIYSDYTDNFCLTPLGALIIAPVISRIQNLLENTKI